MKMRIERVILNFVLVTIIISCMGCTVTSKISPQPNKSTVDSAEETKKKEKELINLQCESVKKDLQKLSEQILNAKDDQEVSSLLKNYHGNNTGKNVNAYFARPNGKFILAPYVQLPEDYKPMTTPWYRGAVDKEFFVSEPYGTMIMGEMRSTFTVSEAVYKDKTLVGVIGIDQCLEK